MAPLLENRRAFITGATRGIGLAIAEAFVREGAEVIAGCRDTDDVTIGEPRRCPRAPSTFWSTMRASGCRLLSPERVGTTGW